MKTPSNFMMIFLAATILALLTFNPGSARCAPQSTSPPEAQPQARQDPPKAVKSEEPDRREEERQSFRALEELIKGSLMMQYQRLDAIADLEYQLDKD